ncbi:hypothetical protein ACWEGE_13040 [Amycolatopsis sp. NPDC004747]
MPDVDPVLDPVLARMDYELMQMIRSMQDPTSSFAEIGKRFNRDGRTVSRILLEFDKAYEANHGLHVLQRDSGRRGYRLTPAGLVLANNLRRITEMMQQAIEQTKAATRFVPVVCTQNCMDEYFVALRNAIPTSAGFEIRPDSRRTAEIRLRERSEQVKAQVGLLSAMMVAEQRPTVGTVVPWSDRIEVLPLKVERFQLLAGEDLGFREPVDVREAIVSGVSFLCPEGGPAWDFLARSFPDWYRLRPFQYVRTTDLEFGMKSLAANAVTRSAMIVHGLPDDALKILKGRKNLRAYEIAQPEDHQMVAVTGVFYVHPDLADDPHEGTPQTEVWEIAKKLWVEREVII